MHPGYKPEKLNNLGFHVFTGNLLHSFTFRDDNEYLINDSKKYVFVYMDFNKEEVILKCDWVICHGGHNTIIQSILNGVPLIIFPDLIFERRYM